MSEILPQAEQEKKEQEQKDQDKNHDNMDKKEIADEEREKMLNAENTKHSGAPPDGNLEVDEHKPKRRLPIGPIKMPGFCRSKPKATKDDDTKPIEQSEAAAAKDAESAAEKAQAKDAKEKESRANGLLKNIKLPNLSQVFNRRRTKEADAELGNTGLTSADGNEDPEKEKNPEDGMETVRLDGEAVDGDPPKQSQFMIYVATARRYPLVTGVVALLFLATMVLLGVACFGSRRPEYSIRLIDNKYVPVQTSCGLVQGALENGTYVFRGIPYAQPPVGDLRFQPAQPRNRLEHCWKGVRPANVSAEKCWQRDHAGHIDGVEDCLYLDIYTPKITPEGQQLSVVVMIGAETLSGPSPGVMEPPLLMSRVREIVFVRPNFRLGVTGFLASDLISKEARPRTSGNYGLSDIVAVLKWIELNILHFGGDKNKVTLWGHRAGGTLVMALLNSHPARSLFQRAWIASGSSIFPSVDLAQSENFNKEYIDKLGCQDLACLRNKTAEELWKAVPNSWQPVDLELPKPGPIVGRHEWLVKDNLYIKDHVGDFLTAENLPVQVLMGSTAQSGASPKMLAPNFTMTEQEVYKTINDSLIGQMNLTDQAIKLYGSNVTSLATMISDIRVVCPLLTVARMNPEIPFYVARFPKSNHLSDADADAEAILGTFLNITAFPNVTQTRHFTAIQQLFSDYIHLGTIKNIDMKKGKRVLVIEQDSLPMEDYENCNFWINHTIVPVHGRVD